MKIAMLSGWAQDAASLSHLAESPNLLDYQSFDSFENFVKSLNENLANVDVLVGWSLGGQVAYRLVCEGYIRTSHLILLSAPFQYVNNHVVSCGIGHEEFNLFQKQISGKDAGFIKKFQSLITHGDIREKHIKHQTNLHAHNNYKDYWLNYLGEHSCEELLLPDLVNMTLVYGEKDCITSPAQGQLFHTKEPSSQLIIWRSCGHAPHLHDPEAIRKIIYHEI